MSPPKLQPALLGGLFTGTLSALPIISAGNLCCCLWVVAGGLLAAYLMQQNHVHPVTPGDGAAVGLLAGVCGALVYTVVAIPISLLMASFQRDLVRRFLQTAEDVPAEMRGIIESMSTGVGGVMIGLLFMLFAGVIFGTAGGLIGALIFRRGEVSQPPVPRAEEPLPPQG